MEKNEIRGERSEAASLRLRELPPVLRALSVLLVLVLLSSVCAVSVTLASYPSDHTLTYEEQSLTWDGRTEVAENGSAVLTLFGREYQNARSENTDRVIAPGTKGENRVVLRNSVNRSIRYTAVAYLMKDCDTLRFTADASGKDAEDTDVYPLPTGVTEDRVIRAMTGGVDANGETPFLLSWEWSFEDEDVALGDGLDTELGDRAAAEDAEEVTIGLYIVVEDNGGNVYPPPRTGDTSNLTLYLILIAVSAVLLIGVYIHPRKRTGRAA